MNLIVLVDRNQNLLESKILEDFPTLQPFLQEKINNSVVILDEKSCKLKDLFNHTKKIFFDEKKESVFPDFLSEVDASQEFASNFKQLFEKINGLEKDNVFMFGDKFSLALLPYAKKIYMFRLDSEDGESAFPDLLNSPDFEVIQGGEPYLYDGEQFHLSIFKNLAVEQYNLYTKRNEFVDK